VDIPSGVSGLTGAAVPGVPAASATVTFGALKPGLLLGAGRALAGAVEVAPIGLDCSGARAGLVTDADVAAWVPARAADAHKWRAACWVVAGSPGMTGAADLAAAGAQRGGAGYVRLSVPGAVRESSGPIEAVGVALPETGWAREVAAGVDRFGAVVLGPGLGRVAGTAAEVRALVAGLALPLVVDGDGLWALGKGAAGMLRNRNGPTVLTPHDGEFERLCGARPGPDRFAAARELAAAARCVVLLKGPTTVVAGPDGAALAVIEGDERLATAGTGDVLAGMIGALLARGTGPLEAAAAAAFVHGRAGRLGPAEGLVAGDLPGLIPQAWATVRLGVGAPPPRAP
jgi:NAD(P)H-hydrate epimerase